MISVMTALAWALPSLYRAFPQEKKTKQQTELFE